MTKVLWPKDERATKAPTLYSKPSHLLVNFDLSSYQLLTLNSPQPSSNSLKEIFPFMLLPVELGERILLLLASDHDFATLYTLSLASGLLRVYALPIYLRGMNLLKSRPGDYVTISLRNFEAVPRWRGLQDFRPPQKLSIWVSRVKLEARSQVRMLTQFFGSLGHHIAIREIHIDIGGAPISSTLNFLDAVRVSGVSHLRVDCLINRDLHSVNSLAQIPFVNSARVFPRLESLYVSNSVFFSSRFIHWTLETLNSSSLTALRLQMEESSPSWRLILPQLRLPSLRLLYIDGALPVCSLFHFLRRHLHLRELKIGHFVRPGLPISSPNPPTMASLARLEGPLGYVLPLLAQGLPRLERLSLFPDFPFAHSTRVDFSLLAAMSYARMSPELWDITITLPHHYAVREGSGSFFFSQGNGRREQAMNSMECITLCTWRDVHGRRSASFHSTVMVSTSSSLSSSRTHSVVPEILATVA